MDTTVAMGQRLRPHDGNTGILTETPSILWVGNDAERCCADGLHQHMV